MTQGKSYTTSSYSEESLRRVKPLLILTGPTSVGKTAASIGLAKALGCEIISADSMQVYRGCDIGSAKIRPEEMQSVPHYLIDEFDPEEDFNVMIFRNKAKEAIDRIYANGHIPLLVGGTGFYLQAVIKDIDFTEEDTSDLRAELEAEMVRIGPQRMHDRLREVDPESAEAIPMNNQKRVIRALEYFLATGRTISEHNKEQHARKSPYTFRYYCLTREREALYRRIEERIDQMMEEGLEQEVRALKERGCTRDLVSMQGLGYKEILSYLDGECTLDEAIAQIKLGTRHFAKRQLTWFRREEDVIWVDKDTFGQNEDRILTFLVDDARQYVTAQLDERKQ